MEVVDYVTTSYGAFAYSKFRLGEVLDRYLYEDFYIVVDIHIFVFINPQVTGAYFTHLPVGWGFSAIP